MMQFFPDIETKLLRILEKWDNIFEYFIKYLSKENKFIISILEIYAEIFLDIHPYCAKFDVVLSFLCIRMGSSIFMEPVSSWKWVKIYFSDNIGFTGTIRGMPAVQCLAIQVTVTGVET